jgi:hypothetical protein
MTTEDFTLPTDLVSGTEAEAQLAAFSAPPPAEQLQQLAFLLGEFRCEYVDLSSQPPTSGVSYWTTVPVLGGHFLEMTQQVPVPGIHSRWTFGWNAAEQSFFTTYADDWGNHGSTRCAGWEDGKLNCIGEYFAFGGKFVFNERFQIVDADHYRKECFVQTPDGWNQIDRVDATRITGDEA